MTTKYQRPTSSYAGKTNLSNRTKYQDDAAAVPKIAISSTKIDGDFNYLVDALNTMDEASGVRASIADRLSVSLNEDGTLKVSVASALDDWVDHATNITRVDNSTIKIDGDQTGVFSLNRRVKLTVSGENIYASIANTIFADGETTLELVDLVNNSGAVDVISVAPSALSYGPVSGGVKGNMPTNSSGQKIRATEPLLRLKDTSGSGKEFALQSKNGTLLILENTGTEESPSWQTRTTVNSTGLVLGDDSITLGQLAHGTAGKVVGFDGTGAPAEIDVGVADGSVTTAKLADGAVTAVKLASGAVPAASTSVSGLVELATDAEVKTGSSSTVAVTPNSLYTSLGLSAGYATTVQTITSGGTLTFAHGLGRVPKKIQAVLVCQTAENGYAVGDELFGPFDTSTTGSNNTGFALVADATNLNVRFGANSNVFILLHKTTGDIAFFTNTNWKIKFYVWA